jgi:hypothetical protein
MRTTIRIDDDLLREAKIYAATRGITLTQLIQDALRESLVRRRAARTRRQVTLLTVGGSGPPPGLDLDRNAAALDFMEGLDDPSRRQRPRLRPSSQRKRA